MQKFDEMYAQLPGTGQSQTQGQGQSQSQRAGTDANIRAHRQAYAQWLARQPER